MALKGIFLTWLAIALIVATLSHTLHLSTDAPFAGWAEFLRFSGRATGLVGFGAYTISLVLISRWRWLETLFGGLPFVYRQHHIVGAIAFLSLMSHPVLLTSSFLLTSLGVGSRFLFNWQDPMILTGWISLLLLMLFMTATFVMRLPYNAWR